MMDDLDKLKAALKASPAPDPDAKAAALRLAMENFDRLQGSTDAARLSQDRPPRAGFLNGVLGMLKSLNTRPALAATTSVAALMIGLFVAWPQLQDIVQPAEPPKVADQEIVPPTPPVESRDEKADLGRADDTVALQSQLKPEAPGADQPAETDKLADATQVPTPEPTPAPAQRTLATGGAMSSEAPATSGMLNITEQNGVAEFAAPKRAAAPMDQFAAPEPNTEAFANAPVNPVHVTAEEPVSTFSVDVDTASYAVVRSSLNAASCPRPTPCGSKRW